MKALALVLAAAGFAGSAGVGFAQELQVSAGVDAVSNYVSNGVTQSDGQPAIQPYLELSLDGFYAGTWASTVDFGNSDNWEIDLYLGYRKTFDNNLFVDIGYARYFYDNSGDCCGELTLTAAYPLHRKVGIKGYVAYDPEAKNWNRKATLAYEVNEQLGLAATYGYSDFFAHAYWEAGASLALNQYLSASATYHGSGSGDEGIVVALSLAGDQSTLARFLRNPFR